MFEITCWKWFGEKAFLIYALRKKPGPAGIIRLTENTSLLTTEWRGLFRLGRHRCLGVVETVGEIYQKGVEEGPGRVEQAGGN